MLNQKIAAFQLTLLRSPSTSLTMKPIKKRTTQREIARRAQIGPDFLSHIIHGDRPCPRKVAVRLEAVTGISRVTWVWGTPEEIRQAVQQVCVHDPGYGHHD